MPLNPCRAVSKSGIDASRRLPVGPAVPSVAWRRVGPDPRLSIDRCEHQVARPTGHRNSGRPVGLAVRSGDKRDPSDPLRIPSTLAGSGRDQRLLPRSWRPSPSGLAELVVDLLDDVAARVDDHRHAGLDIAAFHLGLAGPSPRAASPGRRPSPWRGTGHCRRAGTRWWPGWPRSAAAWPRSRRAWWSGSSSGPSWSRAACGRRRSRSAWP